MLPAEVRDALTSRVGSLKSFKAVSGGCINHGGKLTTAAGNFFIKWNDASKFPEMFKSEAKGLGMLSQANCFRVPSVSHCDQTDSHQFILIEWIEPSAASRNFWEELGRGLARLHKVTTSHFGLDHNNYIGSLKQSNTISEEWTDFFILERLEPQLRLLNPSTGVANKFESLFKKLPQIFPREKPSLLHGDLWSGNLITDEKGDPCLIDPAVYYGNREMEIAFTQLFGGFDHRFYDTYKEVFPLQPGFADRVGICNLYPLLVHANLFGGHYIREIEDIVGHWA
jgi:protein-ribulosamine 3-kinase